MTEVGRVVCWFSCGAASAVAAKLTLQKYPDALIVYCKVREEHPDNERFLKDCEEWFGKKVIVLINEKYNGSIYEVFRQTRYLVGPGGARCTLELKKSLREKFQEDGDMQIFGYTREEQKRADRFIDANADVYLSVPLIDADLSKSDCLALLVRAGIELGTMYKDGFSNSNCIGCVKGGISYWQRIRVMHPDVYQRMSEMERELGRTILKVTIDGVRQRVYLDELDPAVKGHPIKDTPISCSFACEYVELDPSQD